MATFCDSNFKNIYALFGVHFFHPKQGCAKFLTFRMSGSVWKHNTLYTVNCHVIIMTTTYLQKKYLFKKSLDKILINFYLLVNFYIV